MHPVFVPLFSEKIYLDHYYRREIILYEANPMSGVFQNIDPPPPHCPASVYGGTSGVVGGHTRWVEREVGGGSIFWKTPDTALYSTYVSTLWLVARNVIWPQFRPVLWWCTMVNIFLKPTHPPFLITASKLSMSMVKGKIFWTISLLQYSNSYSYSTLKGQ